MMRTISLKTDEGQVICEGCLVADSAWTRMRGLLGRRGLESGEGLLITPTGSVHTFFMRFPIDVVFLARDGEVLKVARALPPWRMAGARRAQEGLLPRVAGADSPGGRAGARPRRSRRAGLGGRRGPATPTDAVPTPQTAAGRSPA